MRPVPRGAKALRDLHRPGALPALLRLLVRQAVSRRLARRAGAEVVLESRSGIAGGLDRIAAAERNDGAEPRDEPPVTAALDGLPLEASGVALGMVDREGSGKLFRMEIPGDAGSPVLLELP